MKNFVKAVNKGSLLVKWHKTHRRNIYGTTNKRKDKELDARLSLKAVIEGIFGSHRAEDVEQLSLTDMLNAYGKLSYRMSLKLHFGASSEEQGEMLHQDVKKLEGRCDTTMRGDYCWRLKQEDPSKHKRKS